MATATLSRTAAAEVVAHDVRGVKVVANEVEVRLPSFAERTDADLVAAAARALEQKLEQVPVRNAELDSWAEREEAQRAAWSAPEVTSMEKRNMISYE